MSTSQPTTHNAHDAHDVHDRGTRADVRASRLAGKVAIVTGGTRGFGAAIVSLFVHQGARCVVMDVLASDGWYDAYTIAAPTSASISAPPESAYALKADITSRASWCTALETCIHTFGSPPTIIVNNAGWTYSNKPTLDVTDDEFDRVFQVNVKSVYLSVDVLLPSLLLWNKDDQHDVCWINIASTAALRPRPGLVWCKYAPTESNPHGFFRKNQD